MSGIRNLTAVTQFKIFVPTITKEEAVENTPWVMRLDLPPNSAFLEVAVIEEPANLTGPLFGAPPKKTVGYAFQVPVTESPLRFPMFITSVFAGMDVPWQRDGVVEDGDLVCRYLGISSHFGIPLIHTGLCVEATGATARMDAADRLEEELRSTYLIVRPREYDLDKRLIALVAANKRDNEEKESSEKANT